MIYQTTNQLVIVIVVVFTNLAILGALLGKAWDRKEQQQHIFSKMPARFTGSIIFPRSCQSMMLMFLYILTHYYQIEFCEISHILNISLVV